MIKRGHQIGWNSEEYPSVFVQTGRRYECALNEALLCSVVSESLYRVGPQVNLEHDMLNMKLTLRVSSTERNLRWSPMSTA